MINMSLCPQMERRLVSGPRSMPWPDSRVASAVSWFYSFSTFLSSPDPVTLGMDATHVGMLKCFYRLKQFNESWKLKMPCRTYNTTVNHRRRILYSTRGHPGRWNDKTLQLYDDLAKILRDGKQFTDGSFPLLRRTRHGVEKVLSRRVGTGRQWLPALAVPRSAVQVVPNST